MGVVTGIISAGVLSCPSNVESNLSWVLLPLGKHSVGIVLKELGGSAAEMCEILPRD